MHEYSIQDAGTARCHCRSYDMAYTERQARAPTAGRRRAPRAARRCILSAVQHKNRRCIQHKNRATNSPIPVTSTTTIYKEQPRRGGAGEDNPPAPANSTRHTGRDRPRRAHARYSRIHCTIAIREITRMCKRKSANTMLELAAPVPLGLARSRRNARRSYALNINLISPRLPVAE